VIPPRSEETLSEESLWQENWFEGTLTFHGCCWMSSRWVVVGNVICAFLLAGPVVCWT
jgi:hypothetical protein